MQRIIGGHPTLTLQKWLLLPVAALLLLWPAFLNGFPLIFPDTGAYFSVAWSHFWTVDRSGFYGLFLRPLSILGAISNLWTAVALQSLAIAAVILVAIRMLVPLATTWQQLLIFVALAASTSLPWHSAQLMPDAFTGVSILLVLLAVSREPSATGTPLLWLAAFIAGLMHYTHVVLIAVAATTSLTVLWMTRSASARSLAKRAMVAAAVIGGILATHTIANGVFLKRWSPAPVGPLFLFARLHEDGLVQPWLARHCKSDTLPVLCRLAPTLPRDSQVLLWSDASPLTEFTRTRFADAKSERFLRELQRASLGSISERPVQFAGMVAEATMEQFIHYRVLDDECPTVCGALSSSVRSWFQSYRPNVMPAFHSSRQLQGTMPKAAIRAVTTPVATLSLILLPVFFAFAVRRRDATSISLIAAVAAALIANALITGALSDVHDRYQSRVVWLAAFAVLVVIARWRSQPIREGLSCALGRDTPLATDDGSK